ncbi:alpha/beta fold hydrolase [Allonocardiopsis opalescens]|uniref:Alpha/beta hydrolase family protein n=1 Tax=Allonocardiopsis opalescens TaxID=1144618 RepID=A0A2T0PZ21_9ACTN|nr:alpha/beta hydrolase [Allonocardiopsis opalescens]PRX96689.1 alpha/beta hydrolase family protein [Allonocardiopsis opalescens]
MRLHTREWGAGERTALLVHGMAVDSRTFNRLAAELVRRGYRVLAVDLRGHGRSPRGYYSPAALAADVAETVPAGVDLALGHSYGTVVLSLAAPRLAPRRVVYAEPYWNVVGEELPQVAADYLADAAAAPGERWTAQDVRDHEAARACWDPRTLLDLRRFDTPATPDPSAAPVLVQFAERSGYSAALDESDLRARGFEVHTVPDAGHNLHVDNLPATAASLDRWLGPAEPPGAAAGGGQAVGPKAAR